MQQRKKILTKVVSLLLHLNKIFNFVVSSLKKFFLIKKIFFYFLLEAAEAVANACPNSKLIPPIGVLRESGESWATAEANAAPDKKFDEVNFGVCNAAIWLTKGNGECPFNGSPIIFFVKKYLFFL
jgi:hypothetical protein